MRSALSQEPTVPLGPQEVLPEEREEAEADTIFLDLSKQYIALGASLYHLAGSPVALWFC